MKIKKLTALIMAVIMLSAVFALPVSSDSSVSQLTPVSADPYSARNRLAASPDGNRLVKGYDILIAGIKNSETTVAGFASLPKSEAIPKTYAADLINACLEDHPEIFYISKSISLVQVSDDLKSIKLTYTASGNKLAKMKSELNVAVKKYLAGLNDDMTDYQKEKIIHDRIVANIYYDNSNSNCDNIYGALVEGRALCEGYAKAYKYLLNLAGIESTFVPGVGKGVPHAWNLVKISGDYYYCDITWDDPAEVDDAGNYICTDPYDLIRYGYFNVTTAQIKEFHTIDYESFYPICTATKENYYVKNDLVFDEFDITRLATAMRDNGGYASVYLSNANDCEAFYNYFWDNIYTVLDIVGTFKIVSEGISAAMTYVEHELTFYILIEDCSSISGYITAMEDGPYDITLTPYGSSTVAYSDVTDGEYRFDYIPIGYYTVSVTSPSGITSSELVGIGFSMAEEYNPFITQYGDITGDGNVDLSDFLRLKLIIAGNSLECNPDAFGLTNRNAAQKLAELQKMLLA